jgi:heme-degrading monooxygenase HmoA
VARFNSAQENVDVANDSAVPRKRGAAYLLIRHRVASYRKWRSVFDADGPARKARGCTSGQLFRSANDPRELVVMLKWKSLEQAREFAMSDDLRQTMVRAGVSDRPDVYVVLTEPPPPHGLCREKTDKRPTPG